MARKVLRNLPDPLVRIRGELRQLVIERQHVAEEIRRNGDVDGTRERRLAELEREALRLRKTATEAMRQRQVMRA
jgi:hypothetical protein